jgi:predicted Ser/Thr protein kinase
VVLELSDALGPAIQVAGLLGQGGMGSVYLGRDPALKRSVAIKVLAGDLAVDQKARARFLREAESAARVVHPNVVSVYQTGVLQSGTPYFVMQYVEGESLASNLAAGVLTEARTRRVIGEVASALAAAHARGLVHRDIKPANIMINTDGRAIVLDFGISAVTSASDVDQGTALTVKGTYLGTPAYTSPEQASAGPVTDKSDVYSLGIVAFEALTGRVPFRGTSVMEILAAHIKDIPPAVTASRPDVDPALAHLIDRCLAKDPSARPSAAEVAGHLLPPQHPAVEWPPPGLEVLRGKASDLSRVTAWLAIAVLGLFTLLYLQPAMASAAWSQGETSWFWRALWAPGFSMENVYLRPIECNSLASVNLPCPPQMVDASPLWLSVLTLLGLVLVAGFVRTLWAAWRLVDATRAAHRAGYPEAVVAQVAADGGNDTENLINGTGPFAGISSEARIRLLNNRRAAMRLLTSCSVATAVIPPAWLLGLMKIGDTPTHWLTLPELLVFAAPMAVGVAGYRDLLRSERKERARRKRSHGSRRLSRVEIRIPESLVRGWLRNSEGMIVSALKTPKPLRLHVALAVGAAFVFLLAGVPVAVGAHYFAMWHGPTMRGWEQQWLTFMSEAGSDDPGVRWASIDSVLGSELSQQMTNPGLLRRVVGGASAKTDRTLRAALGWLDADTFGWLKQDTSWSWIPGMRAASDSLTHDDHYDYRSAGRDLQRASVAGILAFEAGDTAAARAWSQQSLFLARHLLRWEYYTGGYNPWGRVHLALTLHWRIAKARGDFRSVAADEDLMVRIGRSRNPHRIFFFHLDMPLMASPDAASAEKYLGTSWVSPEVRRRLASATVKGLCYNPREMLFGMSESRREMIKSAREAVVDLPGIAENLSRIERSLEQSGGGRRGVVGFIARAAWCDRVG